MIRKNSLVTFKKLFVANDLNTLHWEITSRSFISSSKISSFFILIILIIFIIGLNRNIVFAQSDEIDKSIEENIYIYAGKEKTNSKIKNKRITRDDARVLSVSKINAVEKILSIGEKAIPKLEELANSDDQDIRYTSIYTILSIQGKSDEMFSKAISDSSYKVQTIPLYYMRVSYAKKNIKFNKNDEEYKKWQNKIIDGFNNSKFEAAIEAIKKGRNYYNDDFIYIGPANEQNDAELAEFYLRIVGQKSLEGIKKEIINGFNLISIYTAIENNPNIRVNFLTENLLNTKLDKNAKEKITEELLSDSEHYPKAFSEENIKRMNEFIDLRKFDTSISYEDRISLDYRLIRTIEGLKGH